jgi:hypothetical protein
VIVSFEKMSRVFEEMALRFRLLGLSNTLLIDDYKCIANVPFSYIVFYPFDSEVEDNYLLEKLWLYLNGLSKAPKTFKYVCFNPHRQPRLKHKNLHWLALKHFVWSAID